MAFYFLLIFIFHQIISNNRFRVSKVVETTCFLPKFPRYRFQHGVFGNPFLIFMAFTISIFSNRICLSQSVSHHDVLDQILNHFLWPSSPISGNYPLLSQMQFSFPLTLAIWEFSILLVERVRFCIYFSYAQPISTI